MTRDYNQLNGKSIEECGVVLEHWIKDYYKNRTYNKNYYNSIFLSDHSRKDKKRMMLTLYKELGDKIRPLNTFSEIMRRKDYSMLKFLMGLYKIGTGYPILDVCRKIGGETDPFVIKCLSTLEFPLRIVKAFLYGAIENRNMVLITFIVEKMRIDIYIPTHKKTDNTLGTAFTKNDDLELLKWFEGHDYNIHEGQRILLNNAYYSAPRIKKYILKQQLDTEASDLYMEKIATKALLSDDIDLLKQFSKISLNVKQNTVLDSLNLKKPLLYIKSLFTRYIDIQCAEHIKYSFGHNSDGNPKIFCLYQYTRYYKVSQYGNGEIWQFISAGLWKYGDSSTREILTEKGYTP